MLFLDEPFESIDPAGVALMKQWLRRITEQKRTVFITSHVLETVERRPVPSGDLAPVEDGLVSPTLQEDHSRSGEHRDDGHVDVGDGGEQQCVFATQERAELCFDPLVEDRASQQSRPAGVRTPGIEVCRDCIDDLSVQVEPQVVARREVVQPVIPHPNSPAVDLIDHRIEHRVRRLQSGHPVIEPLVGSPSSPSRRLAGPMRRLRS